MQRSEIQGSLSSYQVRPPDSTSLHRATLLQEKKTTYSRQGAKHAQVFLSDNKQEHEVPGVPGAFAREKIIKSRRGAGYAEEFGDYKIIAL